MPTVTVRRRSLLLGLVAGLGSFARGCIPALETPTCAIQCDDSCPPDLVCLQGFCVPPGFSGVCPALLPARADAGDPDAGGRRRDPCALSDSALRVEPCPLPPPCVGVAYEVQLGASSGVAPYTWSQDRLPEGLALSAEGVVSGVPLANGTVAISVRDASGEEQSQRYEVAARDSCWFAYVDSGESEAALQLFDPVLSEPGQGLQLPRAPAIGSVQDFAFSADGRWLAVRVRDGDSVDRLALFSAPGWEESELPLPPGSVLQYAWSPAELGVLAVALREDDATVLSGVRTSLAAEVPGAAATLQVLQPVTAPVDSALVWFDGDRLVFHGATEPGAVDDQRLYFTQLGAEGFGEVVGDLGMSFLIDGSGRLRFEPVPGGVAAVFTYPGFPNMMQAYTPSTTGFRRVNHRPEVILSPDGRYTARASDGDVLQVYRTLEEQGDPDALFFARVAATSPGCERLLAWSADGSRVACVTPSASESSIAVFSLDAGGETLLPVPIEGFYAYDQEAATFRRRAFSPAGSWFAFTTELNLYLADLTGSRFTVERGAQPLLSMATGAELAFSPDERWLLRQQGTSAWLQDLSVDRQAVSLPPGARSAAACQETEGESQQTWCGASGASSGFEWSADSSFAAYASAPDQLLIVAPPSGQNFVRCATSCGQHVFQP
ncbi:MAG: putative Ig domain-containing protein [Polyangiaceae bacterium]